MVKCLNLDVVDLMFNLTTKFELEDEARHPTDGAVLDACGQAILRACVVLILPEVQ